MFIVETFDLKRVDEMVKACVKHFPDHEVLQLDIQTGELKEGQRIVPTDNSPVQTLHQSLTSKPCIGVISYVLVQEQAQMLYNNMLSWHQSLYGSERMNTVVVFTASAEYFPPALRRFLHTITIPASTPEERHTVLTRVVKDVNKMAQSKGLNMDVKTNGSLIDASAGLTLQDVEAAALESVYRYQTLRVEEFTRRKMEILRQFGIEYVEPTRGFETVAGYQDLKDYVAWRIIGPLKEPARAQKMGLTIPKGAVLVGPPGTGKTYFTKALAKEVGLTMLKLSPADFLRSYVGESETRVRQVTQLIETLAPCIVFIDEFDQMATPRAEVMQTDSGVSRRVTNQLLDWLGDENRRSIVIGATNFANLDKAFIRPGRIDEILPILPPDTLAREEILRVHSTVIRKVPLANVDFKRIADRTMWWSGAELEKLILDSAAIAFKENSASVTGNHFDEAIKGFEVNIQEREKSLNTLLLQIKRLEQYNKAFLEKQLHEFQKTATPSKVESMLGPDLARPPDEGKGIA